MYAAADSTIPSKSKKRLATDIEGMDSPSVKKPAKKKFKAEKQEKTQTSQEGALITNTMK